MSFAPEIGRLGWIACQRGLSRLDLESALLLQQARRELGPCERLGELFVQLELLTPVQRDALLETQRAWWALSSATHMFDEQAEALAAVLASRRRFDVEALEALLILRPGDLREIARNLPAGPDQAEADTELLRVQLAAEGVEWPAEQLARMAAGPWTEPRRAERMLAGAEARRLIDADTLRRADRIARLLSLRGWEATPLDVLIALGALTDAQHRLLEQLADAAEEDAPSKLIAGWAGRFALIVRRAGTGSLRRATYRFHDGEHVLGSGANADFALEDHAIAAVHARLTVEGDDVRIAPVDGPLWAEVDGQRLPIDAPHRLSPGDRFDLGATMTIQFLDADGIAEDSHFFTLTVQEIFQELSIDGIARRTDEVPTLSREDLDTLPEREPAAQQQIDSARMRLREFHERESTRIEDVREQIELRTKAIATTERRLGHALRRGLAIASVVLAIAVSASTAWLAQPRPEAAPVDRRPVLSSPPTLIEGQRGQWSGELRAVVHHADREGRRGFYAVLSSGAGLVVVEGGERVHHLGVAVVREGATVTVQGVCRAYDGPPARLPDGTRTRLYVEAERLELTTGLPAGSGSRR